MKGNASQSRSSSFVSTRKDKTSTIRITQDQCPTHHPLVLQRSSKSSLICIYISESENSSSSTSQSTKESNEKHSTKGYRHNDDNSPTPSRFCIRIRRPCATKCTTIVSEKTRNASPIGHSFSKYPSPKINDYDELHSPKSYAYYAN